MSVHRPGLPIDAVRPTGARATRKVRRWAAGADLGALRHVEASTPNAWAWCVTIVLVLVLVFVGLALVGGATAVEAAALAVTFAALAALILWFLGSEKLLVLDRGLVIGSFAPFVGPYILPFAVVDASTVRAIVAGPRAVGRLLGVEVSSGSARTVMWSRYALTFLAVSPGLVRAAKRAGRTPTIPDARALVPWAFTARSREGQVAAVHAFVVALIDARCPGVELSREQALPARRVRGTAADAQMLGLAGR